MNFNQILVEKLKSIDHFQRYPEMIPFVGANYGKFNKKMLLLGESHFLPEGSTASSSAEVWYKGNNSTLDDNEKGFICTFDLINNRSGQQLGAKSWRYYLDMENELINGGLPKHDNMFTYVSFMNVFQRPAVVNGESINVLPIDLEEGEKILNAVIDIIQPEIIIFMTSLGYNHFHWRIHDKSIKTVRCCHTTCSWWNRESKGGMPREVFVRTIKESLSE